jgi:hypothetical protein
MLNFRCENLIRYAEPGSGKFCVVAAELMTTPKLFDAGAVPRPTADGSAGPEQDTPAGAAEPGLPVASSDLEKLARWVPKKEMALLRELCERAGHDPDLARPALLLCSAYAKRVARMLDQDPFPTVTRGIAESLRQLRAKSGL